MPISKVGINRDAMQPWLPLVFSALLSMLAIVGPLVALMNAPMSSDWWLPVFAGFLPMCFFFAGSAMSQMRKEIAVLRQRVAALEQTAGVAPGGGTLDGDTNTARPNQFSLKFLLAGVAVLALQFALIAKLLDKADELMKASRVPIRAPALPPPATRIRPVPPTSAPRASIQIRSTRNLKNTGTPE